MAERNSTDLYGLPLAGDRYLRLLLGCGAQCRKVLERHLGLVVDVLDPDRLSVRQPGVTELPVHVALVSIRDQRIDIRGIGHLPSPEVLVEIAGAYQFHSAVRAPGEFSVHVRVNLQGSAGQCHFAACSGESASGSMLM